MHRCLRLRIDVFMTFCLQWYDKGAAAGNLLCYDVPTSISEICRRGLEVYYEL